MDEITRLQSDLSQLAKRVDDMTLRLAIVENEQKYFDEKISDLKVLIIEKNQELRDALAENAKDAAEAIGRWNKIGFWLITLVGGYLVIQVLGLLRNAV